MAIQKPKKEKYVTTEVFENRLESLEGKVDLRFRLFEEKFERAMASIAQSFARNEGLFEKIFIILEEIREDTRETRKTVQDHDVYISKHERKIDDLTGRVEIIEKRP